nr:PREDICTED: xyloside xylosyltransferase 1 [Opisthocomus hoazin]
MAMPATQRGEAGARCYRHQQRGRPAEGHAGHGAGTRALVQHLADGLGQGWVFGCPPREGGHGDSAVTLLQPCPTVGLVAGPITLPRWAYCGSHERLPASGELCSDAKVLGSGRDLCRRARAGAACLWSKEQVLVLRVIVHDVNELTEKLFPIVEAMQKHFSAGSGTYYSDSIFFLSVAMHRIMPKEITQIIQVDLDLKYKSNIRDLFDEFDNFAEGAVIGIAREMQPVYRHTFWQYRRENPQTKVGEPPPDGLPGFNSGVLLLNLEAMRQSKLYNQLLEPAMVQKLTEKYHFKGHLGDQDFFTMVGMEHPELFHVLDCTWNRQLCTWWRDHGYSDVFDQYFQCEGEVKIYHGNCNTPIPED